MAPLFSYRDEAGWRTRLAVSIAMWPRGEVRAGVLVIALGYNIDGPMIAVAALCLALSLAATGLSILAVKRLLRESERVTTPANTYRTDMEILLEAFARPDQEPGESEESERETDENQITHCANDRTTSAGAPVKTAAEGVKISSRRDATGSDSSRATL